MTSSLYAATNFASSGVTAAAKATGVAVCVNVGDAVAAARWGDAKDDGGSGYATERLRYSPLLRSKVSAMSSRRHAEASRLDQVDGCGWFRRG